MLTSVTSQTHARVRGSPLFSQSTDQIRASGVLCRGQSSTRYLSSESLGFAASKPPALSCPRASRLCHIIADHLTALSPQSMHAAPARPQETNRVFHTAAPVFGGLCCVSPHTRCAMVMLLNLLSHHGPNQHLKQQRRQQQSQLVMLHNYQWCRSGECASTCIMHRLSD